LFKYKVIDYLMKIKFIILDFISPCLIYFNMVELHIMKAWHILFGHKKYFKYKMIIIQRLI